MIKPVLANPPSPASFELLCKGVYRCGQKVSLQFRYIANRFFSPGSRLWLLYDLRQLAGVAQTTDEQKANFVSAKTSHGKTPQCVAYGARTLDLYPQVVEFLHVCEIIFNDGLAEDESVVIQMGSDAAGWVLPDHPIRAFHFWLVESEPEGWRFETTGYKTYRSFRNGNGNDSDLISGLAGALSIRVEGKIPRPTPENTRRTPGILWGELHGMAFNQRPLDDFYRYARDEAKYDFAAALLFSYNICVDGVWDEVKAAAARWSKPGGFLAIVGVEAGTVPDGSHRKAHFLIHPERVPPIFCEDRPPATDPRLHQRFNADTIICKDLNHYYSVVKRYEGIVSGHFHTLVYDREILAEIWQKQKGALKEEARIFQLLNQGHLFGINAGSDTHDSMPGNPEPEPGCPMPAGQMAVLADELTPEAIHQAILARRVYGTTGARIALRFESNGKPMGSILPAAANREFAIEVEGSQPISHLELIKGGAVVAAEEGSGTTMSTILRDGKTEESNNHRQWYLLKVTQTDGHRAWSSPIWFE